MRITNGRITNFYCLSCFAIFIIEKNSCFWVYKNGFIGKKVFGFLEDISFLT